MTIEELHEIIEKKINERLPKIEKKDKKISTSEIEEKIGENKPKEKIIMVDKKNSTDSSLYKKINPNLKIKETKIIQNPESEKKVIQNKDFNYIFENKKNRKVKILLENFSPQKSYEKLSVKDGILKKSSYQTSKEEGLNEVKEVKFTDEMEISNDEFSQEGKELLKMITENEERESFKKLNLNKKLRAQ